MRVLTRGILRGAKIWLLILAVAIASLALAPGSRPADATGGTEVYFTFSPANPVPETNIVSTPDGPPVTVYVWAKNPKDPDWDSGVGAYEVDFLFDPTRVFITTAEYDQCGLDHNLDDDGDLRDNDGCPAVGPPETGSQCNPASHIDDDGDGFVNDGCPQFGATAEINQCANALDDDGDGKVNDGCMAFGAAEVDECANAIDDDGDGRINNGCPMVAPPAETGAACQNSVDDEGAPDGWVNDGCPLRPEEGPECDNSTDDDGDTVVNDGCPTDEKPESGAQCANNTDDDGDLYVNDGCPPDGSESGAQCNNNTDDDGDGTVNDGCPAVGLGETEITPPGPYCGNDLDDDGDTVVNDGCPETSSSEAGGQCLDTVDEDGDGLVNDGCPARGQPELGSLCENSLDDDSDGWFNDGCPAAGPREGAPGSGQCDNATDDDGDSFVNDGCPQRGPVFVETNPSWLGQDGRSVNCSTPYTREVAGSSPLRWHVNFSCTSQGPPNEGVQVSGLLGTFTLRPGTPFGIGPLAFTSSTNLHTPGHLKDINPPDGEPDTVKEPTALPATVRSAQWRIARCGDRTGDRYIAFSDFLALVTASGTVEGFPGWDPGNDLNDDGTVGFIDFLVMIGWSGRTC